MTMDQIEILFTKHKLVCLQKLYTDYAHEATEEDILKYLGAQEGLVGENVGKCMCDERIKVRIPDATVLALFRFPCSNFAFNIRSCFSGVRTLGTRCKSRIVHGIQKNF